MLVLVVGPSGAGKDTLISGARAALAGDNRFVFPRRVVTRPAVVDIEDHESASLPEFQRMERAGAFALAWEAHGLHYGVPAAMGADLASGRVAVVNASRRIIAKARQRFAALAVVLVDAQPEIRARRLGMRGRETDEEIAQRLAREVDVPLPGAIRIDNSGEASEGIERLVAALRELAGG